MYTNKQKLKLSSEMSPSLSASARPYRLRIFNLEHVQGKELKPLSP